MLSPKSFVLIMPVIKTKVIHVISNLLITGFLMKEKLVVLRPIRFSLSLSTVILFGPLGPLPQP
jgi:hypothetical protein